MDDKKIIELFFKRSEKAIKETDEKYGLYCRCIAKNILQNNEDSEECVSDTYAKLWNVIPPTVPVNFKTFIGRITRNLSLDRLEKGHAQKRGPNQVTLVLEELQECLPSGETVESVTDNNILKDALNSFLESLTDEKRKIFMRRYWYISSIKEIASDYGVSESKVKMILLRTRNELKNYLEKEGIEI
ncbi:MAG: sigma-70 family RNA polymerase sigma factor [Faecalibacterium sp.]|nr:sigma-70 family RNA polymerase sigma factor [Ruminococcus sp.]MCM1392436.1 sigma-70 family RNA polymerase sigma factor [Ruminococcus sp.]MCM1486191.1 sigma-70 family RNA polymerase sigma factor [Faecalibacterium sp.]